MASKRDSGRRKRGRALVSMVCNLTTGKAQNRDFEKELKSVLTKAEELRRELTKIIEEDVEAFDAVMRAYGCLA